MNTDKAGLLDRIYTRAFDYEGNYGSCPQAVLAAISDFFDIFDDTLIKAAQGLAGGGALCGDGTCGALAGGHMAIAGRFGRERKDFGKSSPEQKNCYYISRELHDRFVSEYGSPVCSDVQTKIFGRSFDLWNREDYRRFEDAGAHKDKCTGVAGNVARWTAELLLERGVSPRPEQDKKS